MGIPIHGTSEAEKNYEERVVLCFIMFDFNNGGEFHSEIPAHTLDTLDTVERRALSKNTNNSNRWPLALCDYPPSRKKKKRVLDGRTDRLIFLLQPSSGAHYDF